MSIYCMNSEDDIIRKSESPYKSEVINDKRKRGSRLRIILLITIFFVLGFALYNSFVVSKPVKTVDKFIHAFNDKDINKMVECIDPIQEKLYKAASNLLSKYIGFDLNDVADMFPYMYILSKNAGNTIDANIKINKIISKNVIGKEAIIETSVTGTFTYSDGRVEKGDSVLTFFLKKFDEGWRIVNIVE